MQRDDLIDLFGSEMHTATVVAALPGKGWTAYFRADEHGTEISRPVLTWLVYDNGEVVPCDVDDDGLVYRCTVATNFLRVEPRTSRRSPLATLRKWLPVMMRRPRLRS